MVRKHPGYGAAILGAQERKKAALTGRVLCTIDRRNLVARRALGLRDERTCVWIGDIVERRAKCAGINRISTTLQSTMKLISVMLFAVVEGGTDCAVDAAVRTGRSALCLSAG